MRRVIDQGDRKSTSQKKTSGGGQKKEKMPNRRIRRAVLRRSIEGIKIEGLKGGTD